jgi:tetratricopeptide (TPR) repeat protein
MANDENQVTGESPSASGAGHDELMEVLKQGRFRPKKLRLTPVHVLLGINTLALAAAAVWYFGVPRPKQDPVTLVELPVATAKPSARTVPLTIATAKPPPTEPEAVSAQSARSSMLQKDYSLALVRYTNLSEAAIRAEDPVMADFFRLRGSQCMKRLGRNDAARTALMGLVDSLSPAVRAWALYELATIATGEGQFLQARSKAYGAIAALHLLKSSGPLEADCDFMIGRAMTSRATVDATDLKWPEGSLVKILDALDESNLRVILTEGSRKFSEVLPSPMVQKVPGVSGEGAWKVACLKTPLEEFLARLSAQSGMDIQFAAVAPTCRTRAVTLFEESMSIPRICEIAGGLAGLVARYDGSHLVLADPQTMPSLQEQVTLFRDEALAHWRRVCLRYPDDARTGKANFEIAALMESAGDLNNAMTQYLLTAGRFGRDPVAPQALLRSAKIRITLRDFVGARGTLLDLLNTYPDIPETESAYLALGQSGMKAGMFSEAAETFTKLYFRELSLSSRTAACAGAGQCFYQLGKYDQACLWLGRYLKLGRDQEGAELVQAYLLLGKSEAALEHWTEASGAFHQCIRSGARGQDNFDAVMGFARAQSRRECYASALGMVRRLDRDSLPSDQRAAALLLEGQILRSMSLPQEAAQLLNHELTSVDKPDQLTLKRELAVACVEATMYDDAHRLYLEILPAVKPPDSHQVACEFAQLCLTRNRLPQAETLCRDLLGSSAPEPIKAKARELLGQVLMKSQQYNQAITALATPAPAIPANKGGVQK